MTRHDDPSPTRETLRGTPHHTVVGASYLHSIGVLLDDLDSIEWNEPNDVQASIREHGASASLILLLVAMFESLARFDQYLWHGEEHFLLEYLSHKFPHLSWSEVEEIFVIRDLVTHNHIWGAEIFWTETLDLKATVPILESGGDQKFQRVLDMAARRTRTLGLNVVPTRICRIDVAVTLREIVACWRRLDRENDWKVQSQLDRPVRFRCLFPKLKELSAMLDNEWGQLATPSSEV